MSEDCPFEKNVSVVLRAFVQILKKKPKARLSVIGDGPALPACVQAQNLEIGDSVDFPGFIPNSDLPGIYPSMICLSPPQPWKPGLGCFRGDGLWLTCRWCKQLRFAGVNPKQCQWLPARTV